MSKYQPLEDFLKAQDADQVPMTFADVERVIGDDLPPAAYAHRAWWSNNPRSSVATAAWLRAGFESSKVRMQDRCLIFRRAAAVDRILAATARAAGYQLVTRDRVLLDYAEQGHLTALGC